MLKEKSAASNDLVQEKYITLSIPQRKIEDTRAYFRRVDGNLCQELWAAGFRGQSHFQP